MNLDDELREYAKTEMGKKQFSRIIRRGKRQGETAAVVIAVIFMALILFTFLYLAATGYDEPERRMFERRAER